jgi:hypothetical protein
VSSFLLLVLAFGWLASNLTLAVIYEQVHVHNVRQRKLLEADMRERAVSAARAAIASAKHAAGDAVFAQPPVDEHVCVRPLPVADVGVEALGARDGAGGCWGALRAACASAVAWPWFNYTFTLLIVANTIAQCVAYADMPLAQCKALDVLSLIFTCLFVVELFVKLLGLGPSGYAKDRANIFDAVIVTIDVLVLIVTVAAGESLVAEDECAEGINPSIFRTLRLVRLLFRLPIKVQRDTAPSNASAAWRRTHATPPSHAHSGTLARSYRSLPWVRAALPSCHLDCRLFWALRAAASRAARDRRECAADDGRVVRHLLPPAVHGHASRDELLWRRPRPLPAVRAAAAAPRTAAARRRHCVAQS